MMWLDKPIELKGDKRFKVGNIKQEGRTLRGNPETMKIERLESSSYIPHDPPLVVSNELAKKLKRMGML